MSNAASTDMVRASLHVRGADAVTDRAERNDLVAKAAEALERHGVHVVWQGRRTLTVEARPSLFRDVLGVQPPYATPVSAEVKASTQELSELVDHMDIEPAPLLFTKGS